MSFAHNTPIQYLPGIGSRTAQVLHSLEVYTAGQLMLIPPKLLVEIFGPSFRSILHNLVQRPVACTSTRTTSSHHYDTNAKNKKSIFKKLQLAAHVMTLL